MTKITKGSYSRDSSCQDRAQVMAGTVSGHAPSVARVMPRSG